VGRSAKYLLTGAIVLVAVGAVVLKYRDYVINPWTRDGQVRAEVIQIAPRVSGPIVNLPVRDNQIVKAGNVLFEIDPRTFEASVEQARADLDETRDNIKSLEKQVEAARASVAVSGAAVKRAAITIHQYEAEIEKTKAEFERQQRMLQKDATSQKSVERAKANYAINLDKKRGAEASLVEARASLSQAEANLAVAEANLGAPGTENARLRAAKAAVKQAELNLEFTKVRAPVDGYVTNLTLRLGSQVVANQAALAFVDLNSFWIHGYFKETTIANIGVGDRAIVTLMSYPDNPLEGHVDSLGWGIAQDNGSPGYDLLPTISATFEWIRLAQRVPVRVHLVDVPNGIELRVGTTASVLVMHENADSGGKEPAPATPKALQ
jgi:multidrug resistance efflux pump